MTKVFEDSYITPSTAKSKYIFTLEHYASPTLHYGLLSSKTILDLLSFLYHIFTEKDGGRRETYCLYGVEGDSILSIL